MGFLSPIFLLGAMAAAIPVLVHLVRRTRARKEPFPSLMFLRRIDQKTIRKRTLRNLLLLALRCAAILLLAFAFSRPYFPASNPLASGPDAPRLVVLIDSSFSMGYAGVFERARQAARNILNEAAANEQTALISFSETYEIVAPLKVNNNEAKAMLDQLKPGLGATDYLQALQAADSILKDGGGRRRIFLISDFQDAGWNRAAPPFKLSGGIELVPVDVSDPEPANLAVSEIEAEPVVFAQKYVGKVTARVSNFSRQPRPETPIEFKLNDLTVERRQIRLDAGESQTVDFSGFNVPEGSNRATIEVTGDSFALDDKGFFTIRRADQTNVLAIDTASRGRSESFFIQQALLAGENNQHALVVKTAGTVNPADVASYKVVIINDANVSEALATSIKDLVNRGGGLVIAAGKHTDPGAFNRLFRGVAPVELGETVQTRGGYSLMSQVKTDHPLFSLFARSGRLTSTRVYAFHRSVPIEKASVIAALDDGTPIIVEGAAGNGKVLQVNTTFDTTWSDLPLTPMFLPLVRQMLEYLGGQPAVAWHKVGQVFTAAPDPDGSLPAIQSPGGARLEERRNPEGGLSVAADEIGFYRLRYRDRAENVAVNLDAAESDLSKLNLDDLVAAVSPEGPGRERASVPQERLTPEQIEARQRVWLPLLVGALGLFVLEAVLSRRIRLARFAG